MFLENNFNNENSNDWCQWRDNEFGAQSLDAATLARYAGLVLVYQDKEVLFGKKDAVLQYRYHQPFVAKRVYRSQEEDATHIFWGGRHKDLIIGTLMPLPTTEDFIYRYDRSTLLVLGKDKDKFLAKHKDLVPTGKTPKWESLRASQCNEMEF